MIDISVIITTYGSPIYLSKSIKSVLNQTLKDFELIIVDDNNPSSQNRNATEKIVNSFKKKTNKIKYIKHEENLNGAAARNTGVDLAKGKYISFLDNDDFYKKEKLNDCYKVCESYAEDYAGAYSWCEIRRDNKFKSIQKKIKSGSFINETLACRFPLSTGSNLFIRRDVYNELGGFDVNFKRHQDYEFLVRLFEKYKLIAIPKVLIIKNNENINFLDVRGMIKVKNQLLNKYKYIIDDLQKNERNYIFFRNYVSIAEQAISSRDYPIAFKYYKKVMVNNGLQFIEFLRMVFFIMKAIFVKKWDY